MKAFMSSPRVRALLVAIWSCSRPNCSSGGTSALMSRPYSPSRHAAVATKLSCAAPRLSTCRGGGSVDEAGRAGGDAAMRKCEGGGVWRVGTLRCEIVDEAVWNGGRGGVETQTCGGGGGRTGGAAGMGKR
eukprot:55875-Chlamydomonas_euryale.AAC.1